MEYTKHQKEYIDSVEGQAHMSAILKIGELENIIQYLEEENRRLLVDRSLNDRKP